jgi:hypothetical protein
VQREKNAIAIQLREFSLTALQAVLEGEALHAIFSIDGYPYYREFSSTDSYLEFVEQEGVAGCDIGAHHAKRV